MPPELASAAPSEFPANAMPPESTLTNPPTPRKWFGTTGVAQSTVAAAQTTSKSFKATTKSGKVGRSPLAPVLSGPRAQKPTEVMNPITLHEKARAYWEIARVKILAQESGGGGDGGQSAL
jgi:hypothetical protein